MLVLTRKSEESVIVGSNIEIKVLGIRGDQVSLGFKAPDEVSIYRKEVYEAIQKENLQAVRRGQNEMQRFKDAIGQHFTLKQEFQSTRKEGCEGHRSTGS
jgi:carbon storage regulator